ncbi:hypothetical protein PA18A_4377 [Pseudomonas aeruginosa 18A]|nr:hypothetical protein PA18A_4377 [Pseudomonas aeruginosa 18A]
MSSYWCSGRLEDRRAVRFCKAGARPVVSATLNQSSACFQYI